jgi:hypothetical protein
MAAVRRARPRSPPPVPGPGRVGSGNPGGRPVGARGHPPSGASPPLWSVEGHAGHRCVPEIERISRPTISVADRRGRGFSNMGQAAGTPPRPPAPLSEPSGSQPGSMGAAPRAPAQRTGSVRMHWLRYSSPEPPHLPPPVPLQWARTDHAEVPETIQSTLSVCMR